MSKYTEAAELLQERIASMQVVLDKQILMREKMIDINADADHIADIDRIIEGAEAIIEQNKELVELIRNTVE